MLSCFLASKLAVVCLVTLPGVKQVECIEIGEYNLCIDTHYDTACLQESARDWYTDFGVGQPLVGMLDTLNTECSEQLIDAKDM